MYVNRNQEIIQSNEKREPVRILSSKLNNLLLINSFCNKFVYFNVQKLKEEKNWEQEV